MGSVVSVRARSGLAAHHRYRCSCSYGGFLASVRAVLIEIKVSGSDLCEDVVQGLYLGEVMHLAGAGSFSQSGLGGSDVVFEVFYETLMGKDAVLGVPVAHTVFYQGQTALTSISR